MNIKKQITEEFGTVGKFAKLIGAPIGTVYSWTRDQDARTPTEWQYKAFIRAARAASAVAGWKCRNCGAISEATGAGIRPSHCGGCGQSGNFTPVSIMERVETNKES